ncbi:hypothetical protein [Sediminitomix flava]|uniref:Uncharacterized protein n=1 Tax=Sediminitomix flava TaxID=379075 RepID=A0A315ZAW1_SEDFL|nr:hypothetical protein [Sediminitomix flava]PWJ42715.1 hypothetical protein BC781_102260 [Sediminitomix flava]
MTARTLLPTLDYDYKVIITKDYGFVYVLPAKQIMICELTKGYVPIEEFREIFNQTIPFIKAYNIEKFIFDKQNLTTFHQPSMEWYFIDWKTKIYDLGVTKHRKILPKNNPVFKLAVEAGRAKIMKEFKESIIPQLDILYKDTLEEAISE